MLVRVRSRHLRLEVNRRQPISDSGEHWDCVQRGKSAINAPSTSLPLLLTLVSEGASETKSQSRLWGMLLASTA